MGFFFPPAVRRPDAATAKLLFLLVLSVLEISAKFFFSLVLERWVSPADRIKGFLRVKIMCLHF